MALLAMLMVNVNAGDKTYYNYRFAPSTGLLDSSELAHRHEICLNGYWDFQPVKVPADYRQGAGVAPELKMPVASGWSNTKIKIPSPWNINSFANRGLEGPDHRNYPSYPKEWDDVLMGWMRKTVTVPAEWNGEEIRLYFEAVAGETVVYVNGHKAGENFDLFLPFSFDITPYVTPGQSAEILVGVRSQKLFEDNSTVGRRIVPAGSMWGYHINGIWQDVFMLALPKVRVDDVFVKPLVAENTLELNLTLTNNTSRKETLLLGGVVRKWINKAGSDINSAPEPAGELGQVALDIPAAKIDIPANSSVEKVITVSVDGRLEYWSPEHPNLYGLVLDLKNKKEVVDVKYERFGWRQWTFRGTELCLNGEPYQLHGDAWHFQGIPQMTRRYAYAWYKAIKDMNSNAVRPHAQVYPRFYLDMADEMGICVLDETANWASDGGPKLDSELFWEHSKDHLARFVKRDRNHASVFGWSISNENKPVILHVYNRPDLMPQQMKAWEEWRDIVRTLDPTRQWISSDGEDDGDGILPVTVGHYGDRSSMERWRDIGKPWGVGEHAMAYYGTPEQVSKYNGERAYESQEGRMEGLANECYNLIADQRSMGASYTTVFNMAWYALQPLPLGKKNLNTAPDLNDGIFFADYEEGVPGVQPERVGPYSTTFNPGYDPSLPLYREWPMYAALRAANAPGAPAWSEWAEVDKTVYDAPAAIKAAPYDAVYFVGRDGSRVKSMFDDQGVVFAGRKVKSSRVIYIVDATVPLSEKDKTLLSTAHGNGADIWLWGVNPSTVTDYAGLLPLGLDFTQLRRSSFLPSQKSWIRGLNNSDFYFCEIQKGDACGYAMAGPLVEESEVLLTACPTDWRKWNKRPEELKTAGTLRSENEAPANRSVFIKYHDNGGGAIYASTLTEFANSEKGFNTLSTILSNAGIPTEKKEINPNDVFFVRDGELVFPASSKSHLDGAGEDVTFTFYAFSPRPLDDLLIEPDMPKLTLVVKGMDIVTSLNGKRLAPASSNRHETTYKELPLLQGWNRIEITLPRKSSGDFTGFFRCDNKKDFESLLKASYINPEEK